MAIPTTETAEVLFSSTEPAWEAGVDLTQAMQTAMTTSRAGLEQRQQKRIRGIWQIAFTIFHDMASAAARRLRSIAETQTAVVVPFWTEEAILASLVGNVATISRRSTVDWFAPGDYVLLIDGTTSQFRVIASQGSTDQELNLVALTGAIAFPNLSRIIPCRVCSRENGDAEMVFPSEDAVEEKVSYVTL